MLHAPIAVARTLPTEGGGGQFTPSVAHSRSTEAASPADTCWSEWQSMAAPKLPNLSNLSWSKIIVILWQDC